LPVSLPQAPTASAPVVQTAPEERKFEVVLRTNEMDLESVDGRAVYFVGSHPILRTPTDWAEKLGEEPKWFEFKVKNDKSAFLSPTTFKDAKGRIHPAYFMKTVKEIQLWMHRQ
jgi:hypothetical protein